jgi:plastocyanin
MVVVGVEPAACGAVHVVQVGPGLAFTPAQIEIQAGDTVRWEWMEAFHTVNSGVNGVPDGSFCSPGNLSCDNNPTSPMGAVYEKMFDTPGTFPYYCRIHSGMEGVLVVFP